MRWAIVMSACRLFVYIASTLQTKLYLQSGSLSLGCCQSFLKALDSVLQGLHLSLQLSNTLICQTQSCFHLPCNDNSHLCTMALFREIACASNIHHVCSKCAWYQHDET